MSFFSTFIVTGIRNYAFRRHGIDPVTCCADVEELIESEHIIKVEFKGRTSYRNASKYFGPESASSNHESSPQQPPKDKTPEPVSYSSAVTAAIAAILCDQPTPPSQTGAVSIRRLVDRKPVFPHLYIFMNFVYCSILALQATCNQEIMEDTPGSTLTISLSVRFQIVTLPPLEKRATLCPLQSLKAWITVGSSSGKR